MLAGIRTQEMFTCIPIGLDLQWDLFFLSVQCLLNLNLSLVTVEGPCRFSIYKSYSFHSDCLTGHVTLQTINMFQSENWVQKSIILIQTRNNTFQYISHPHTYVD
jgi:hypothetical protein